MIILVNNGYLRDIVGPCTTQLSSQNFGLHFENVFHSFGPAVYGRGGVGPIITHISSQKFYPQLSQAPSIIVLLVIEVIFNTIKVDSKFITTPPVLYIKVYFHLSLWEKPK